MTPLGMGILWSIVIACAFAVTIGAAVEWLHRYEKTKRELEHVLADYYAAKKDAEEWQEVADNLASELYAAKRWSA